MPKKYPKEVCFYITHNMHKQLQKVSEARDFNISQLLRALIRNHLPVERGEEIRPKGETLYNTATRG